MKIAHVLFEDAEELDFVGPWEVFTMVRELAELQNLDIVKPHAFTVSEAGGIVRARKGMRFVSDHSFADCPQPDIIVVPGGQGTRTEVNNPAMLAWIAKVAPGCAWVTSVCTGAMLLTAAGPAKGKSVTTHWAFVEALRKREEAREVKAGARWVRDGNVVTAAGVSAGIDMALWLTGQIWSPDLARNVQRAMEYDPAPPYQADV